MSKVSKFVTMFLIAFTLIAFANLIHKANVRQVQADTHAQKACAGQQLPVAYFCYAGEYQKEVKRLNQ